MPPGNMPNNAANWLSSPAPPSRSHASPYSAASGGMQLVPASGRLSQAQHVQTWSWSKRRRRRPTS